MKMTIAQIKRASKATLVAELSNRVYAAAVFLEVKTKSKKRKEKPSSRVLELHAALSPMADGCMKTSLLAYKLAAKRRFRDDQGANTVLNLAADTLAKINGIMKESITEGSRT